jgi:hypothetical protein
VGFAAGAAIVEQTSTDREEVNSMGTKKVGRSAVSGRFVKKSTVARKPRTTVTQTVKTGKKRK